MIRWQGFRLYACFRIVRARPRFPMCGHTVQLAA